MLFKQQNEFPLLEEYQKLFDITDRTIFAYNNCVYTNYELSPDLIIHEQTHLKQQDKYGLDNWINYYLTDVKFRLKMEVEAYRKQLESIKDREFKFNIKQECIRNLCSGLYGDIVTVDEAKILLK